jgi:small subunit ribosomal protein S3
MKKSLMATMKMGAQGIKIQCGGRLGGAEIARSEKYMDGRVPCHTLRADIDYAHATANTTYGTIGVKVWIFMGEIIGGGSFYREEDNKKAERQDGPPQGGRGRRDRDRDPRGKSKARPKGRVRRAGGKSSAPKGRRPDAGPGSQGRPPRDNAKPSGAPGGGSNAAPKKTESKPADKPADKSSGSGEKA